RARPASTRDPARLMCHAGSPCSEELSCERAANGGSALLDPDREALRASAQNAARLVRQKRLADAAKDAVRLLDAGPLVAEAGREHGKCRARRAGPRLDTEVGEFERGAQHHADGADR